MNDDQIKRLAERIASRLTPMIILFTSVEKEAAGRPLLVQALRTSITNFLSEEKEIN